MKRSVERVETSYRPLPLSKIKTNAAGAVYPNSDAVGIMHKGAKACLGVMPKRTVDEVYQVRKHADKEGLQQG